MFFTGFLGVVAIAVIANLQKLEGGEETGGQTSEAAALLTYALGALLATESYAAAIVVGGVTAVLLHFKRPLHFVDVDAITLSTAQLAAAQRLDAGTAWKIILVAALANLALKAGVVFFLGSAKLFVKILPVFGAAFAGGVAILLAWPG